MRLRVLAMSMEMNFPHNRRRPGRLERSNDFALLVATVVARQLSAMGKTSGIHGTHPHLSQNPLADRIEFFGSANRNPESCRYGPFLPEEIFLFNDVNKCKQVVYLNDLANRKSTGHRVDLPEEPAALRGMEV